MSGTNILRELCDPNRLAATKRDEEAAEEIKRLRKALRAIVELEGKRQYPYFWAKKIAREALRYD